jgi:hypothetical protein
MDWRISLAVDHELEQQARLSLARIQPRLQARFAKTIKKSPGQ